LIAKGIAPFNPESVALEAGKIFIRRLDAIVSNKEPFAFETTLSGLNYIDRIKQWKQIGYEVILYFLKLPSEEMKKWRLSVFNSELLKVDIMFRKMLLLEGIIEDGEIFKNIISILSMLGLFLTIQEIYRRF